MIEPGPAKDTYRWIAKGYDTVVAPLNRPIWQIAMKMRPPRPDDEVLDVGCGTGTALVEFQRAGFATSGIDLSAAMLARAKGRLGDSADLRVGDATALPYEDSSFDLVTAAFLIHELPPPVRPAVVAEMLRVTKPGGRTMVIDHAPGPFHGMKGRLSGMLISTLEFVTGREHFRNFRQFEKAGGVPGLVESAGLAITEDKLLNGGTIGLYVLAAR